MGRWVCAWLMATGCTGSNLTFPDTKYDTGAVDTATGGTETTPTGSTSTSSTSGSTSSTDTSSSTTSTTDTTSSTTSSTTTPSTSTTTPSTSTTTTPSTGGTTGSTSSPLDGRYTGTVRIEYEVVVPLVGGNSVCTGPVTLFFDSSLPSEFDGTLTCDWPLFDFWAALWVGDVDGFIVGRSTGGFNASGDVWGRDSTEYFVFDAGWTGTMSGTTMNATFSGGTPLFDNYTATFDASWVGPL